MRSNEPAGARRARKWAAALALATVVLASTPSAAHAGKVFVANFDGGPTKVSVRSTDDFSSLGSFSLPGAPQKIAVNGTRGIATNGASTGQAYPFDTGTLAVGTTIPVPSYPTAVVINPAGTTAYVLSRKFQVLIEAAVNGAVTPIDLATGTAGTPIAVGKGAAALTISPDGTKAYAVNGLDRTVTPIDLTTNTAGAAINVGDFGLNAAFTPDGKTVLVTGGSYVRQIDVATNTVKGAIPVTAPNGIAVTPDGTTAWVTSSPQDANGSVIPITLATGVAGQPIGLGTSPSANLAIRNDGRQAYVTETNGNVTKRVDLVNRTVIDSFASVRPTGVAVLDDAPASRTITIESGMQQQAPVGRPYPQAITARVTNTATGAPISGTQVTFTPPATSPTATLSAITADTDADGRVNVTVKAGPDPGFFRVDVEAAGATKKQAELFNVRTGFSVGDQLGSMVAADEHGATHNIQDYADGEHWTMLSIDAIWCQPSLRELQSLEAAKATLAAEGIALNVVSLLHQGPSYGPSTQNNAAQYKARHNLSGPFLHAGGSDSSELFSKAYNFLGRPAAFPTTLLVSPEGKIVDRVVGGRSAEAEASRIRSAAFRRATHLSAPVTTALGTAPGMIEAADMDADGGPDLVGVTDSGFVVGSGADLTPKATVAAADPIALATGRFSAGAYTRGVALLQGADRDRVRVHQSWLDENGLTFGSEAAVTLPGPASNIATGDLNLDGRTDVVTTQLGSGMTYTGTTISILYRNASGDGFLPVVTQTVGTGPKGVAIGDVNDDGKPDIVTANYGDGATLSLLTRNAQNTGFAAAQTLAVSPKGADAGRKPGVKDVAIADLDGDGRNDIAAVTGDVSSPGHLDVLYRNADNTGFKPVESYTTGIEPFRIALGDLNGDGRLDVATANYQGGTLTRLLRNAANTGYDRAPDLAVGGNPANVALGDFDGQGRLDVATAGEAGGFNLRRGLLDSGAPTVAHDVPSGWKREPVAVHLTATDTAGPEAGNDATGVATIKYLVGVSPADPAVPANQPVTYDPASPPVLTDGQVVRYVAVDKVGNAAAGTTPAAKVDATAPQTTDNVPSTATDVPVEVTLTATDAGSGVSAVRYLIGPDPADPADPASNPLTYDPANVPVLQAGERIRYSAVDVAGNVETSHSSALVRGPVVVTPTPTASATAEPTASPTAAPNSPPATVPTATSTPGGGAALPTAAQIIASLKAVTVPVSGAKRIGTAGNYKAKYTALTAGVLEVKWLRGRTVVGSGKAVVKAAGVTTVKVTLTKAGKKVLKAAKKLKLTARTTFTPAGGTPITTTRAFTLKTLVRR